MQWFLNKLVYTKNLNKTIIAIVGLVLLGFAAASFTQTENQELKGRGFYALNDTNTNSLIDELAPKINYQQNTIHVELNPLATGFMQQYKYKQGKWFDNMKTWGKPYFDLYDQILPQYGIPKELKYLSVIESNLRPGTISTAGAVGPWQLMNYEARKYGLRMSENTDERMDFYKSTHAACKLINELYSTFNDWLLVIAAYNGGVGRVKQAIKKSNSTNFWNLQYYLPLETRNHVKKFIATHYIFEGSGGWTTMTAEETDKYIASFALETKPSLLTDDDIKNTVVVEVGGRFLSVIIANYLLLDIEQFNKLNPRFDKTLAEGKKYSMRISADKLPIFEAKKSQILLESMKVLLNSSALTYNK